MDAWGREDAEDAMRGTFEKVPLKLPSKIFGNGYRIKTFVDIRT